MPLFQQPEMLNILFKEYAQVEVYQNILKLTCWALALTLNKSFFLKKTWNKKYFSSFLKSLQLPDIILDQSVGI